MASAAVSPSLLEHPAGLSLCFDVSATHSLMWQGSGRLVSVLGGQILGGNHDPSVWRTVVSSKWKE